MRKETAKGKVKKSKLTIRTIKKTEYAILSEFLYHAIFLPPEAEPLSREVLDKPEISIYIDGFGGKKDCGVVAIQDGKPVGAAWAWVIPAFGYIDDKTPELAISVLPEYRGQGIGTKLLKRLFDELAGKGYKQTSLSVQKNNPAFRLYQRLGYKIVSENEEDYIMLRSLKNEMQAIGVGLGLSLGVAIGAALDAFNGEGHMWLSIGIALGMAIGSSWYVVDKTKKK
ncbi:MAG: GNAT family N-acetyltransferase [Oscillospiraceae bacterium]|jgi:ribosomal protein S18 acetylase RimI-like enzyme|nr:GNAT family N-acetyltransferase [Oscillospiraceae bacterium]